ncbi:hypothetical protein CAC42_1339 [Sphaceloma murrayae]|uniref:Uncharacterized protein n=1 Tax=Sphaceloma murrayae TaxID=2082308 RepID=A0A2K1QFI9_9PEZI|nr:hypothetical protein CAC42_1339 [Sphaceloma murrayae]
MFASQHASGQVSEDLAHDNEDPPDENLRSIAGPSLEANFVKSIPRRAVVCRRESLLTKQLHASEGESPTEDEHAEYRIAGRAQSNSSMAELTSDNDLTSTGTRGSSPSPTLLPVRPHITLLSTEKHINKEPIIVEQEEGPQPTDQSEKAVESGLGRRRCITFACGRKASETKEDTKVPQQSTVTPPKRKCAITFACPTRTKPSPQKLSALSTRHISPAPRSPRSPRASRQHRGSESTVTNSSSPSTLRKIPSIIKRRNRYADDADEAKLESKRFHEFAVDLHADEEWTEEVTCHRKRLTVRDTLHKENVIRKMGEEVEAEVEDEEGLDDEAILDELDMEEEDDDDDIDEDEAEDDDDDDEDDVDDERRSVMAQAGDNISDCGFDTDDEGGSINDTESDDDGSDFEWWAPGRSTAATSTDQLEHIRPSYHRKMSDSSLESAREANGVISRANKKSRTTTAAVKINRPSTPELPDSTDFVCGTLDEDRPLEQAYLSAMEQRKAAKHKITPQDIDPTFPTSDPDMDEEDEEDEIDQDDDEDDDSHLFMHGNMDIVEDRGRRGGHQQPHAKKRSPRTSPRRLRSPPPPAHRVTHRSPPPPARRASIRSPPPPCQRGRLRSPPPRKLFGGSPHRLRSPPPSNRPTSPPNSRSSSIGGTPTPIVKPRNSGLGSRPQLTQTASLPRVPTMTKIQNMATDARDDEDEEEPSNQDLHSRKAIDIVKGLEKKRQRRKEKLYQKHCQKAKKEAERKCKPGKGAERMRELGLELAAYRGNKAEHMLSY